MDIVWQKQAKQDVKNYFIIISSIKYIKLYHKSHYIVTALFYLYLLFCSYIYLAEDSSSCFNDAFVTSLFIILNKQATINTNNNNFFHIFAIIISLSPYYNIILLYYEFKICQLNIFLLITNMYIFYLSFHFSCNNILNLCSTFTCYLFCVCFYNYTNAYIIYKNNYIFKSFCFY